MSAQPRRASSRHEHTAAHALELEDLEVVYRVRGRDRQVLRGVTLDVQRGRGVRPRRRVGLRQVDGRARGRAVPAAERPGAAAGAISIAGRDVLSRSDRELRSLRANDVSMVYQNPGTALNPSMRVGRQVAEVFTVRGVEARRGARAGARGARRSCRSPTRAR